MSATNSTISWLQAFQPLPLLALNTMFQPVGRVLGSPANNIGWLRASPFICALGALALVLRLLAYCALLHATVNVIHGYLGHTVKSATHSYHQFLN
jgi:hypothetical protein